MTTNPKTDLINQPATEVSVDRRAKVQTTFLLDTNPSPVLIVDDQGKIVEVNAAVEELMGSAPNQFIGMDFIQCFEPKNEAAVYIHDVFLGKAERHFPLVAIGCLGRRIQVICNTNLFIDPESGKTRAFVVLQDVTDLRQFQAQLRFQATRDPLTSLLNRPQMRDHLIHSIAKSKDTGQQVCLVLLDLDGFKDINDAFGHAVGDELLKFAATRLLSVVDKSAAVGRLGGNEFAVICGNLETTEEVEMLTGRLVKAISDPFTISAHEIAISCCVGITLFPLDGVNADAMLRDAAIALHRAKQEGEGHIRYFTSEMNQTIRRHLQIANCLRRALANDEFELMYQPRARLSDGRITGVEALIRWQSAELGPVSPGEFIPVAEQRGLIVPIGEWVLQQACKQAAHWQEQYGKNIKVAVNLSGRQLTEANIVKVVEQALANSGLDTELLELELTESMLMKNSQRMLDTLWALKEIGISLAIDDFGTGYSSLSYLKRFPLDYLKIDRSFVVDIPGSSSDEAIAKTIIAMSHSLGLKVIAEGVENFPQLDFFLGYGCDEVQGYLLAKPMAVEAVSEFIQGDDVWNEMRRKA